MSHAILVLNGGPSSLKFSAYRIDDEDEPALLARGQLENLDGSPHFRVKDRKGHSLADARLDQASPGRLPFACRCTERTPETPRLPWKRQSLPLQSTYASDLSRLSN